MTGTAQCTHSFYNKRMCKSYDCPPYATRLHKATDSRAVKSGGRQAVSLYNQLGGVNNRQMGIRDSERLPDPFYQPASSRSLAKPSCVLSRAKSPDTGGSRYPGREGCYYSGTRPSTSRLFLLHSLPGSQKGGSDEASDKPQEIERMGGTPALQDGRYGDSQGIIEDRQLDGEGRPERCLLHNPSTPQTPIISEIHSGARALPVHMPTIRPVLCPMGLHQSDETNSNFPPQHGGAHDSLHRRYTPVGGLPEPSGDPPTSLGVSVNKSGIYHQLFQVDNHTYPEDRVSGVTGGLNVTTLEFTRGKTPPDQDGGEPNQTEITHYSPTAGTADR